MRIKPTYALKQPVHAIPLRDPAALYLAEFLTTCTVLYSFAPSRLSLYNKVYATHRVIPCSAIITNPPVSYSCFVYYQHHKRNKIMEYVNVFHTENEIIFILDSRINKTAF